MGSASPFHAFLVKGQQPHDPFFPQLSDFRPHLKGWSGDLRKNPTPRAGATPPVPETEPTCLPAPRGGGGPG